MPDCDGRTHPFLQFDGCDGSRQTPIRFKRSAIQQLPVALAVCTTPEELWYRNASKGDATFRAAGNSAPIHGWLTLQAVRFNCTSGTAGTASHSTFRAAAPVTTRGLPAAVESFTRSSASCQMVCAPSEYGNTRVRACALAPCARESGSSWLSCARRSAWLRCRNAGRSSQPR